MQGISLIIIVAVLLFVSPLGIWNRLIKIHRDQQKSAKELSDALDRLNFNISKLMRAITTEE